MSAKNILLKNCAEVIPGFSAKGSLFDDPEGTVQVITAQHLKPGEPYCYQDEHRLRIRPPRSFEKYLLEPENIIFMSRGSNNYAVLLEEFPQPAITSLTFFIIKPKPIVFPAYLAWCLNQEPFQTQLKAIRTGAGTPMIPRREFGETIIPLPTMTKQKLMATLAELQRRERDLLRQILDATDRLHRLTGMKLLSSNLLVEQE
jgi:restriction endonuclease S subunit